MERRVPPTLAEAGQMPTGTIVSLGQRRAKHL
jgi:hypothetical protein